MFELIESSEVKGIKFGIYFRPSNGKFFLFVGGVKHTCKATLKGVKGVMNRIIEAN